MGTTSRAAVDESGDSALDLHLGWCPSEIELDSLKTSLFVNDWAIRIVVLCSFAAHLVLTLFAGIRRRKATGVRALVLWLAYQLGGWAGTYALGSMSLGRTTQQQQQQLAFWAPFLLLHLAGPDNITAYSLEDTVLAGRQVLTVTVQILGASYVLYKQIYNRDGGGSALLWVSVVMFAIGIAKYVERAVAIRQANLGKMRSSNKKCKLGKRSFGDVKEVGNERTLLVAHGLLHITKGAFIDHSDDENPLKSDAARSQIFGHGWEEMCRVVEMELSLMYDILYTKVAVVHTWFGYIIRLASPVVSATAFLLFWFQGKDEQRRADVLITYILMVGTIILDVRWLLRAMVSTWTYSFLNNRPDCWFHAACLSSGRWRLLRRLVLCLDPCRLLGKEPTRYRMWSGTVGQYNLLHECTHGTIGMFGSLLKKVVSDDSWMEYQYHDARGLAISSEVRELLFQQIWEQLKTAYPAATVEKTNLLSCSSLGYAGSAWKNRELDEAMNFAHAFQETILIWHIATDIFLLVSRQFASPSNSKQVQVIMALSNYMAFLVAVRPSMLPGLKLRSLYEETHKALVEILLKEGYSGSLIERKEKLADRLIEMEKEKQVQISNAPKKVSNWRPGYSNHKSRPAKASVLYDENIILSDGAKFAEVLLSRAWVDSPHITAHIEISPERYERIKEMIPKLEEQVAFDISVMLDYIFKAWVRILMYASVRCTRDSHAKQLACGGELTTIVWILNEHAGIFRIPGDARDETGELGT
uniref:DUF4220 domain-containing protein n=1 Tax=Oryza rufipogon TaxID=4529 RepID=A0A0E0P539_ORYRU